jgi:hypothetical protein
MNYNKLMALAVGVALTAGTAFADTGWMNSYAYVWDGSADTFYDLNGADQTENFDGADLGQFGPGYTLFLNAEINAWADSGDAYTDFSLFYRVYSGTPGTFTQDPVNSIDNVSGNDWRGLATDNDLSGLGVGTYTVDLYVSRSHTWDAGAGGPYTTYLDINGDTAGGEPTADFFSASFEVIPEPGTMGLLAIGLLGVAGFRRRMK